MVLPEPTVTVVGCSGKQGHAVADALLKMQKFKVRGISRDPSKPSCQDLKRRGVEIMTANLNEKNSLRTPFEGATCAFLMTDFYDDTNNSTETQQGMNEVEAARAAGVKHIVYSSLVDAESVSNGKYKLQHFTGKYRVEEHLRKLRSQGAFESVTFVYPSFYWQNFAMFFKPRRQSDGSFEISLPTEPEKTPITGMDITDLGLIVAKILANPKSYDGQRIMIASETLTMKQLADNLSQGLNKRIVAKKVSDDEARRAGMNPDFIDMFKFFRDYGYFGGEEPSRVARELNPNMKDFRTFMRENHDMLDQL